MNINKVEELAKKIYGVKITKNPLGNPMYEFTGTELAMFAELLVKECALQCVHNEDMDLIEKHFGVEK